MELDDIKALIALMNDNGLAELEVEQEGTKVRLVKEGAAKPEMVAVSAGVAPMAPAPVAGVPAAAAPAAVEVGVHTLTAPMVGTFYRAPSPDSDPFVDEGMKVTEDTTVCIIEAMKVMNEIHAEVGGTVIEVLVENGQPVEYGQPLFKIKMDE
jgi:acetyl-CoA carboxylase biotin carboxyl carrier protein